jgi:hypothetical protein
MKKFLTVLSVVSVITAWADLKLPARHFKVISGGSARLVSGEELFSKAIELKAGAEQAVTAELPKGGAVFVPNAVYEAKAEIKGRGTAFLEIRLLTGDNQIISRHRVITRQATARFLDIEGKLDLRGKTFTRTPAKVNVVIGVEKGGCVAFDDIELEIDND